MTLPDLNHPGLALDAVSPDVDLGPDRPADHFDHADELDLPPLPAQLAADDDDEVT